MLQAPRPFSDEELSQREEVWRALLWDGAPSHLVGTLARSRHTRLADLTPPVVAELASRGDLGSIEDALELSRLAAEDARRVAVLKAMREAREAEGPGVPRFVVVSEPGLVLLRLRPDLRECEFLGLDPHELRGLIARLKAAASEADEMARRRS